MALQFSEVFDLFALGLNDAKVEKTGDNTSAFLIKKVDGSVAFTGHFSLNATIGAGSPLFDFSSNNVLQDTDIPLSNLVAAENAPPIVIDFVIAYKQTTNNIVYEGSAGGADPMPIGDYLLSGVMWIRQPVSKSIHLWQG